MDLAEQLVSEEEGRRPHVYQDKRGYQTIGVGCLVDPRIASAGLCDAAISVQFAHDSAEARAFAARLLGYPRCNSVRQAVLISMCFQLGDLKSWTDFKAALAMGDYNDAANAMLESDWARIQTPERAKREAWMMRTGTWLAHGEPVPGALEA